MTRSVLTRPYFLVTCTVPAELRPAFAARPEELSDLLFATAARALQTVAAQPKHLGAELGLIGVLHTWGSQLQLHPHVHFIVPGGGLTADRKTWRAGRRPDYLLPVAAVGAQLRLGFEAALRATAPALHAPVPAAIWEDTAWVVHCQPAGSGETAVKYLARYVQRTAITDARIVQLGDDTVTFRYTDSATQEKRESTLGADEFLRRYLQHAPPAGAHRVRYCGWLHPAAKARRAIVETLLAVPLVVREPVAAPPAWHLRCAHCGHFPLVVVGRLPRTPPACER